MTGTSFHNARKVESLGSFWFFDEENLRYMRMPKTEQPRENGWGGPDQGELQDLVWHDYITWFIDHDHQRVSQLKIQVPAPGTRPYYVVAPMPEGVR